GVRRRNAARVQGDRQALTQLPPSPAKGDLRRMAPVFRDGILPRLRRDPLPSEGGEMRMLFASSEFRVPSSEFRVPSFEFRVPDQLLPASISSSAANDARC